MRNGIRSSRIVSKSEHSLNETLEKPPRMGAFFYILLIGGRRFGLITI